MDGLGYIPALNVPTLHGDAQDEPVLVPVRKQKQRARTTSLSRRARTLVSRSKSLFSTASSASSIDTSASMPACSPRSSDFSFSSSSDRHDQTFESFHARCGSTPSSCPSDRSQDRFYATQQRPFPQLPSTPEVDNITDKPLVTPPEANFDAPRPPDHLTVPNPTRRTSWISGLIDSDYTSVEELSPPSSASACGLADEPAIRDSFIEPSRASSLLDCDMIPDSSPMSLNFPVPGPLLPLRLSNSSKLLRLEDIYALGRSDARNSVLQSRLAYDSLPSWETQARTPPHS
ncbi:hypothetical protein PaG_05046 [Moesziomyces aphidis]|uniref:Uncharacterized protein n=1 Tax=Moesziomyces aphidis TaxID=84754 RepID=W3VHT6_MOEAP|nr:hypothetical protein PaG_05046 [Moesziomyces aphidis]